MVNEDPEIHPEIEEIETSNYPWWVREIKKLSVGRKFKFLFFIGSVIGILYLMWYIFGWYFLLGLLPGPAWYFWALRQIDRESYTLIEVKIKGDQISGKSISDTQTNIYQVPPDIWKECKIKGSPYTLGNRLYVCELFEVDNEGNNVIHFSEDPRLSNLTFFTKVKLWLDLKSRLPMIEQELAIYKYGFEAEATKKAVRMLEVMGVIQSSQISGARLVKKTISEAGSNE